MSLIDLEHWQFERERDSDTRRKILYSIECELFIMKRFIKSRGYAKQYPAGYDGLSV